MEAVNAKKPYSLWKRRLDSGRFIYYVRFRLDNDHWSTAKSSGQTKKTRAEAWAIEYLKSGQVITKENIVFKDFADGFFDWEGPFIQKQILRGKTIGRRHAENQNSTIINHLNPVIGELKLKKIDSEVIEELVVGLSAAGKAPATINKILITLRTILQHAYKKKYILQMPIIEMIPGKQKERGILTVEEVKDFFDQKWGRYLLLHIQPHSGYHRHAYGRNKSPAAKGCL
ncbi:MAG: phage integrase SAM-like domain-containing protein [Spirochaetales bacterium]|uniref:Phage integrase SAM-like domain-containing protein n=1 Tax=Candidatus Thalassospirochaeta sargassi TaxID=3119039 RepID=A0AAJ1MLJ9_9SPIO|nr:phage integrase SAM-like domain-containing protein [Spirochaetales bacterium]